MTPFRFAGLVLFAAACLGMGYYLILAVQRAAQVFHVGML
jgi:hypothetical protein